MQLNWTQEIPMLFAQKMFTTFSEITTLYNCIPFWPFGAYALTSMGLKDDIGVVPSSFEKLFTWKIPFDKMKKKSGTKVDQK